MRKKTQINIIIALLAIFILLFAFYVTKTKTPVIINFEEAARKATPSVVSIFTDAGSGSGVIIRQDGYIVTNYHVIEDATKIRAMLSDKRIFGCNLTGVDPAADLAILKVNGTSLPAIEFGDSDALKIGEGVVAIGNPYGLDFTVTTGVISAMHRDRGPTEYRDFLQTDAPINPGNSGGALVNLKGELIGINTFIVSDIRAGELGFAIPINLVEKIADQLIKYGEVRRGYLGVTVTDVVDLDEEGNGKFLEGTEIVNVVNGTGAYEAGLKVGDFIIDLDNTKIENGNHLRNVIALIPPGKTVKIKVVRNETEKEFDVRMSERPDFSS